MNALDLLAVRKTYGSHHAVNEVTLAVPEGRCLALLGHNGAGKTTLMKLMLGLTRPSAGTVSVLGADPAAAGLDFRRRLGFLPENVAFHDEMTGRDTLSFYARLKNESAGACDALFERVGLTFARDRRVKTYSKGMRQRLGLAQALLGAPRLLLLDEPTTGLDPVLRQEFFRIIQELTEAGATVVLSSHILTELEARTDLVAILRQGRVVASGTLDELRQAAALPIHITLRSTGKARLIADRLSNLPLTHVSDHSLELTCPLGEKMAMLRHIHGFGSFVDDIDVRLPSLDDVYVHYGHGPAEDAEETR